MDITQSLSFTDERLRKAGGSRDGTNSISHTETDRKIQSRSITDVNLKGKTIKHLEDGHLEKNLGDPGFREEFLDRA